MHVKHVKQFLINNVVNVYELGPSLMHIDIENNYSSQRADMFLANEMK